MSMFEDHVSSAPTVPAGADQSELPLPDGMLWGENCRAAYSTTSSACLDFFFKAVPDIPAEDFNGLLAAAWREDPETALRLVFNLGNCRKGEGGKSDRHNFHRGLLWVFQREPEVVLANLQEVVAHGCWKSLPLLLQYAVHDGNTVNPSLTLEGAAAAAAAHKERRMHIRTKDGKKEKRKAKDAAQARIREEFAASMGVDLSQVWVAGKCKFASGKEEKATEMEVEKEVSSMSLTDSPCGEEGKGLQQQQQQQQQQVKDDDDDDEMEGMERSSGMKGKSAEQGWLNVHPGRWASEEVREKFYAFVARRDARIAAESREAKARSHRETQRRP